MTTYTRTDSLLVWESSSRARDVFIVVLASILISLCGPISISLPFTPVPLAIQAHVCLLLGVLLGSKRGALAVVGFLIQGACGLPVGAKGGAGLAWIFGPTGGYLLGYIIGTFVTGYLVERMRTRSRRAVFCAMAIGNLIVYALGCLHLSRFIGGEMALTLGILPFLIGDFLKLSFATKLYPAWSKT